MGSYTIEFEPVGLRGECRKNDSLLACARRLGIGISSICGGEGTCHSCRVQVLNGTVSSPTPSEQEVFTPQELKMGWRLACQTYPASNCRVTVPPESMTTPQRVQVEGVEVGVALEPLVQTCRLRLVAPSLSAPQADADRLLEALNQQHDLRCRRIDIGVLRTLSDQLRSWNWECQAVVRNDEVIALLAPSTRLLGLAIDLGTTKIAGYLVDLGNGRTLAARGVMNPQISYGEDIVTRMTRAIRSPDEGVLLQKLAV
ncbi:MAG: 2Fe-2S iron-sulfur cluster-binding protein, partial [Dehalococcoidia bacterium]